METIARYIMIFGLILLVIGGLLYLGARLGFPIGRLPGDIHIQRGNVSCFFPLVTSILLSIVLTILLNVVARLLNK